jgi:hypothetical protein
MVGSVDGEQKTRNPYKIKLNRERSDLLDKLDYEHFWYAIIISIIFMTILSGNLDARFKTKYLVVTNENERYIVINKYNDILICYKTDKSKHIISSNFYIINKNNLIDFNMKIESLGYLIHESDSIKFNKKPILSSNEEKHKIKKRLIQNKKPILNIKNY